MFITIFTPAYNRAALLPRLYNSLKSQQYQNFEWVIVDDGSTDNTEEVVSTFLQKQNKDVCLFSIRYFKKQNGGKHTAINYGVRVARGDLFVILDSDDSLPSDSLFSIAEYGYRYRSLKNCAGICGLMAHHSGEIIGSGFPKEEMLESSLIFRYRMNVSGDLLEVFKTTVMREFPFPEIDGEKFCPESLVWNRIASKYKLFCFNKVVYFRDYLAGGLTDRIVKIRMKSPIATMMTYQEMTEYNIPIKWRVRAAINYWRFSFCHKEIEETKVITSKIKWYWSLFKPIGWVMHQKDVINSDE